MTLSEKQAGWVERYRLIPDVQERLAAIVSRKSRLEPLAEAERVEANLVPGCVSRVWLAGEVAGGRLRLRVDAEAGMVRGLVAFLAEFYAGSTPEECLADPFTLLADIGIAGMLTPTRLNGLAGVARKVRAIAAGE